MSEVIFTPLAQWRVDGSVGDNIEPLLEKQSGSKTV